MIQNHPVQKLNSPRWCLAKASLSFCSRHQLQRSCYELSSRMDKLIQNLLGSNLLVFPFLTENVALYANFSEFAFFTYLRESFCFNI